MINTQTQIDSLIDLAVLQRTELKQLVDSLPQLRDHLSSEIERNLEEIEPAIRAELEQFVAARALDTQAKTSAELSAKLDAMARNLESTTAAKYSVLMAERAQNATLLAQAEARIAEAASALPSAVKGIVTDELARFPRAGEIDQLRKEFAEPRGLNPRGRWQASETYNKLDLVSYNGDSYVSNTNGNREKPSRSSEAWTLSAARGNGGAGGGVTSLTDLVAVPANGELLIGNGSAFVNNTLTAGTGVTITNGPGTITIDASGAQELLTATVTNAESFAITRGQVVYLFGATGNRASVKLADNSADATSAKTFGVVSDASIAANGIGLVTCVGVVDKLALGAYNDGDTLYLGNTPGAVTNVKPYAPNHLVYVGIVERANNGNGELYVKIQNGYELDEIHDVQITTPPLAGSLLMRDATNSLWKANRLTGTANQVTVTNADTSVTLSLPTAIANVNSVTAATTQNLTLAGGSTGASLVLLQGANGAINITSNGSGSVNVNPGSTGSVNINSASGVGKLAVRTGTNENAHFRTATAIGGTGVGLDMLNDASGATVGFTLRSSATRLTGGNVTVPDGNVLIGTTTDGGQKLQVAGAAAFTGTISGAGTNTWALQSVGASGALVAGGWLYGINNGFNITPNGAGVAGATLMLAAFDGTGYREMLSTANVASGASTLRLAGYGGPTTVGGTLNVSGAATFAGAVTTANKFAVSAYASNSFLTGNGSGFLDNYYNGGSGFDTMSLGVNYDRRNNAISSAIVATGDLRFEQGTGGQSTFVIALGGTNTVPTDRFTIASTGNATFAGAVTAGAVTASGIGTIGGVFNGAGSGSTNNVSIGTSGGGALFLQGYNAAFNAGQTLGINTVAGGAVNVGNSATITTINGTTPSTGAGSGALQVAGGIYAGAASVFGGTLTVNGGSDLFQLNATSGNGVYLTLKNSGTVFTYIGDAGSLITGYSANSGTLGFRSQGAISWSTAGATEKMSLSTGGVLSLSGAIAIGNTVATAAGVASTHKVTMVIGGVTYYLLASNV